MQTLHDNEPAVADIELSCRQCSGLRCKIVLRQKTGAAVNDGIQTILNKRNVERVHGLIVLFAVRQHGRFVRAKVKIVKRDNLGVHTELAELALQ